RLRRGQPRDRLQFLRRQHQRRPRVHLLRRRQLRPMKLGINLYLWADHMHDGLLPVLESLKRIGYDGVEVPVFDLDVTQWARWGELLDDLGLERTANTVIAPEWNPLSPDPAVQEAAYQHMTAVIDCCAVVGSTLLCGPHQVALGVFTGAGPTAAEW